LVQFPNTRQLCCCGLSCIINPKGEFIAGPLAEKQEILYAEIDLGQIAEWKWRFDATGHYARPDVFKFTVNRAPNPMVDFVEEPRDEEDQP